ncbi:MAG: 2-oxoacid:acceptor oxidoreductase family protein [Desulfococcaceae bacterium]
MREIRFHGRGGQGTVVASVVLAKAFFRAGYFVQTFPVFGVERRGAPVEAYLRLDDRKIRVRSNVYTPDHVVVQDPRLLDTVDVTQGLKPDGWILLNAAERPGDPRFGDFRVAVVNAARIALENRLGSRTQPIINTAMLGAFARVLEAPSIADVEAAIVEEIPVKPEANCRAARMAYDAVDLGTEVAA